MIVDVYAEEYEFSCRQCGHMWRATYGVRQVEDAQGGIWHHYSVLGRPAASPAAEVICPNCKHATVTYLVVGRHRLPESLPVYRVEEVHANEDYLEDNAEHSLSGTPLQSVGQAQGMPSDSPERFARTCKILVGVDRSPSGLHALRWAAAEAAAKGAELEVVVVWEPEVGFGFTATTPNGYEREARRVAEAHVAEALGDVLSIPLSIVVRRGRTAHVLVEASQGAALLVVGSHRHGVLVDALLGSVSEYCVRHARCSVVVVHEQAQTIST